MADSKISALPASTTPLAGTEVLPIVQSGVTKQVSVANLTAGRSVSTSGGTFTDNQTQGTAAKGINFTANTPAAGMTSQLLNWYEEGTWTPTDGSGAGLSFTVTYAKYTRIGNLVTVNAVLTYPATANASAAKISGLPFAAATNPPVLIAQYSNTGVIGYVNSTAIILVSSVNYTTAITNIQMTSSGVLISASYQV